MNNPLKQLHAFGQSFWIDFIQRDMIKNGTLKRMIMEDDLRGMTSNPAIFEKAITENEDYNTNSHALFLEGKSAPEVYEDLSQQDVRMAADEFLPVYEKTNGLDGYVSLEVNPHLANDTQGSLKEARRLWIALNRPNVLIKVPATTAGLPVITQLTAEGINVNITLLFGVPRYLQIVEAWICGLEERIAQGKSVNRISSVASFFVSRIDTLADPLLKKIIAQGGHKSRIAQQLQGNVAIANAKMAYQSYREIFSSSRFKKLSQSGAQVQRLLWASTGTKNPLYSDTKYVESLIGHDTVNTIPVKTLKAFRDHGILKSSLEDKVDEAAWVLKQLIVLGLSMDKITLELELQGLEKFIQSYDNLIKVLSKKT